MSKWVKVPAPVKLKNAQGVENEKALSTYFDFIDLVIDGLLSLQAAVPIRAMYSLMDRRAHSTADTKYFEITDAEFPSVQSAVENGLGI